MKSNHILLSDNRKLGYAEYGSINGFPIIYCHGSQSSRFEMHYDMSFANNNNLRIITIDRPGHGLSSFNPKGTILRFANDVEELLSQLEINEFSVIGMSAGAPFAMGVAYHLHEKTKKIGIVSGFAPLTQESRKALSKEVSTLLKLASSLPFLLKFMLRIQNKQLKRNPKKALKNFLKIMSPPDQEVLKNEAVMLVIEKMFTEAFSQGTAGVAHEISNILVQDWDFSINKIATPTFIWHGSEDHNVPKEWAIQTNEKIASSRLKIYENEGHLIIFKHAEEIFNALA